jgi:uroporphyrinogen decarboxylase
VRERAPDLSVHGEVFSPFSQLCEAVGPGDALAALRTDPGRVKACLEALCRGTVELMAGHVAAGADAVLVSSAYAGGGLISTGHYREFVLPFEARVVSAFKARCPETPVYTHTCGRLGDRLELLQDTGTGGIDTLDPPPLGDVDLADAKRRVGGRLFLKGNVDPVGTVLLGTPEAVRADAARRLEIGAAGGGYVLSTACSVPPGAPPENVMQLRAAAEAA